MEAFRGPSLDGDLHDDDEHASDAKDVTLSDAAQDTIHDIFRELDRNHDGKLQIPEIKVSWACQAKHLHTSVYGRLLYRTYARVLRACSQVAARLQSCPF